MNGGYFSEVAPVLPRRREADGSIKHEQMRGISYGAIRESAPTKDFLRSLGMAAYYHAHRAKADGHEARGMKLRSQRSQLSMSKWPHLRKKP